MMSNALKFGFALQFPEIMDKGLSTVISEAGLFKTFINGDSGFIASSPGRIEASFDYDPEILKAMEALKDKQVFTSIMNRNPEQIIKK